MQDTAARSSRRKFSLSWYRIRPALWTVNGTCCPWRSLGVAARTDLAGHLDHGGEVAFDLGHGHWRIVQRDFLVDALTISGSERVDLARNVDLDFSLSSSLDELAIFIGVDQRTEQSQALALDGS